MHQHESDGVWLVFIRVFSEDEYVNNIIEVDELVRNKAIDWEELIEKYKYQYLRDLLISSQNYSELEELDSQVFLMDYINGEVVNPRIKVDI